MSSEASFIHGDNNGGAEMAQAAATVALAGVAAVARSRHWIKNSVIALSALSGTSAAAVTAVSAFVGYKVVKPSRRVMTQTEEQHLEEQLPPQKVSFKSADGRLTLSGYFYPTTQSKAVIVLCHGFHGGAVDTHRPARMAQVSGYNALTFDFRGCGESEGNTTSVGFWEVEDLLGAIEYALSRPEVDPNRLAVYGYSMGGAVTILAAARQPLIKAIVTDCAFASLDALLSSNFGYFYRLPNFPFRHTAVWWSRRFSQTAGKRVDPVEALKEMSEAGRRLPHLVIHGQKDRGIGVENAHLLYEYSPGPKRLWIVPEAGHVVATSLPPTEYMAQIDTFLFPILRG